MMHQNTCGLGYSEIYYWNLKVNAASLFLSNTTLHKCGFHVLDFTNVPFGTNAKLDDHPIFLSMSLLAES